MSAMQGALSAAERSMRSVFVGNIPYEATEEQLKDIFSEVGPVVSFRLVYDRETGKPKGYGFCEYKDQEMALSAMRNLNGYELNGRALRVDNAASEKSKEELKNLQASLGGPPVESPFGPDVSPDKAPDVISKIMCSLPPEQLYDLMTQMKQCLENNPNEGRTLLVQNPQLTYALLQAQVIMRIVDPETAVGMLHGTNAQATTAGLLPTPDVKPFLPTPDVKPMVAPTPPNIPALNEAPATFPTAVSTCPTGLMPTNPTMTMPRPVTTQQSRPSLLGDRPAVIPAPPKPVLPNPVLPNAFPERAMDPRAMGDHDLRQPPVTDRDMRTLPMMTGDKDMRQQMGDQDLRTLVVPGGVQECRPFDPRFRGVPGLDVSTRGPPFDRPSVPTTIDSRASYEARPAPASRMDTQRNAAMPAAPAIPNPRMPTNPRISAVSNGSPMVGGASPSNVVSSPRQPNQPNPLAAAAAAIAPHDQEKAALIMQVLQLSDQQIAMLPPEQRQSIMVLKEQIARSQQAS